jgi:hypothetical protein
MHHRWLCITPMMNALPLLYYWRYCKEKTRVFTFISFFIACLMLSTIFFWYSPIQNGSMHKIDKGIVIIIGFLTIGYVLFYKLFCQKISRFLWFLYGMVLATGTYFLYLSTFYSSVEWCSDDHIISHFYFHLLSKPSIWFIFL